MLRPGPSRGQGKRQVRQRRGSSGIDTVSTVVFRTYRADGTLAWVESKFKLASEPSDPARTEFLCVIRDVTERKRMEDELTQLNRRLTQLAATDGLTGLTNRRTFDGFLRREYEACDEIAVLLLDIDNFKGYNDTYGHQAGDRCLQAGRESRSAMRPPIRQACPRAMAARNSPSCCRMQRKTPP